MAARYSEEIPPRRRRTGPGRLWILFAGLCLALAAAVGLLLWDDDESEERPCAAMVEQIAASPSRYYGTQLTVRGVVEAAVGRRGLILGDGDPTGARLLVVAAGTVAEIPEQPARSRVVPVGTAEVVGEVRQFSIGEFERELGVDLDDRLFTGFNGLPGILAHSVVLTLR